MKQNTKFFMFESTQFHFIDIPKKQTVTPHQTYHCLLIIRNKKKTISFSRYINEILNFKFFY